MSRPTAFSWGYWGWGNATRQLRHVFDTVERARGFRPPLFVDIRWSRSVRAEGFRQRAFERIVGQDRYVWLRALGNRRIGTGKAGMQIADEGAVGTLLDVIQQNAKRRRRVVFFCACPTPRDHGRLGCHRDRVAELLVHRAKRAGTTLEVVEWPGGRAAELEILVNPSALVALHRGAQTVRLPKRAADRVAHVPLGSTVTLRAGDAVQPVLVDSLIYRRGWQLKVFTPVSPKDTLAELRADSRRLRRELGRLERRT